MMRAACFPLVDEDQRDEGRQAKDQERKSPHKGSLSPLEPLRAQERREQVNEAVPLLPVANGSLIDMVSWQVPIEVRVGRDRPV